MLGVRRDTLLREGGSIRGEEDFFSVARTTPFVARDYVSGVGLKGKRLIWKTFYAQRRDTLIYGVESIFW